jgi:hypothetical protein
MNVEAFQVRSSVCPLWACRTVLEALLSSATLFDLSIVPRGGVGHSRTTLTQRHKLPINKISRERVQREKFVEDTVCVQCVRRSLVLY